MKLLLISNMYPSDSDPQHATFVKNIKKALVNLAHWKVVTAVIRGRHRSRIDKVYNYLCFVVETVRKLLGDTYDIVYMHYPSHSYAPVLLLGPWRWGRLVVHVHGSDILREERVTRFYFAVKRFISARALKTADLIIVPSNYYRDVVANTFRIPRERVFVYSSGGIDMSIFHKSEGVQRKDSFLVGYVGRLEADKGVRTLLQALASLRSRLADLRAIIIGRGTLEQELQTMVTEKGLEGQVSFLGGMQQSALVDHYKSMNVLIFPTERHAESLGLVGLEAMACGVPVIGSQIGGLRDYLKDGYNGFFYEPGNSVDLASKILQFYHLDSLKKADLSANALATAQRYDARIESRRLIQAFETLIQ